MSLWKLVKSFILSAAVKQKKTLGNSEEGGCAT
jgi:hypothetical protein